MVRPSEKMIVYADGDDHYSGRYHYYHYCGGQSSSAEHQCVYSDRIVVRKRMRSVRRTNVALLPDIPFGRLACLLLFTLICTTVVVEPLHAYYVIARYRRPVSNYLIKMPQELYDKMVGGPVPAKRSKMRAVDEENEDSRRPGRRHATYQVRRWLPAVSQNAYYYDYSKSSGHDKSGYDHYYSRSDYDRSHDRPHTAGSRDVETTIAKLSDRSHSRLRLIPPLKSSTYLLRSQKMISSDDAKSAPFDVDRKRSADSMKSLPGTEHVCEMTIKNDFQPTHGHEQNGTRVEIQQDDRRQFRATFIECVSTKREQCHGIDNMLFTSECVTLYEFRPAGVRVEGSGSDFGEGFIKVPVTCQCRLRRKLNRIVLE